MTREGVAATVSQIASSLRDAIEDAMVLREEAASNDGLAAGLVETLTRAYDELRALAPNPTVHPDAPGRLADFKQRGIPRQRPTHPLGDCPACDAWRLLEAELNG